ncbi:hypothetical protein J6380_05845, partial [Leptospira interrogans serovar Copenhageni]|uniref:hypothetical protein n=1 Tax=Leptospira interrogans TaxID=173 RepID=UPI001AD7B67C
YKNLTKKIIFLRYDINVFIENITVKSQNKYSIENHLILNCAFALDFIKLTEATLCDRFLGN